MIEDSAITKDPPNIRPVKTFNEKFHALAQLCSPYIRQIKNSPLTALRMGTYAKILQGYNLERGYSFISQRTIAEELGCSQAAVSSALKWLEDKRHIERIDDRKANKVGRYVMLIRTDNALRSYQADKSLEHNRSDKFQVNNQGEQPYKTNPKRNNGTKVKLKENGPSRCGSRRKAAAPSRGPVDVNKAMQILKEE